MRPRNTWDAWWTTSWIWPGLAARHWTMEITGLNALVEEVILHLQTERKTGKSTGRLVLCHCAMRSRLIKQVFANLLANAHKFTTRNGAH